MMYVTVPHAQNACLWDSEVQCSKTEMFLFKAVVRLAQLTSVKSDVRESICLSSQSNLLKPPQKKKLFQSDCYLRAPWS